jgi:DNA-binding LytR/AlgR family response regulator
MFKFIVIEDDTKARQKVCHYLHDIEGVTVVADVESVKEAVTVIKNHQPDALFLDIEITGGDAFYLLRLLKANNIPIPPLVIMTGYTEKYTDISWNEWYRDHIVHHLTKPFLEDLADRLLKAVQAVKGHLEKKQQQQELERERRTILEIKVDDNRLYIPHSDIIYIEAAGGGKSAIYKEVDQITTNIGLKQLMAELPTNKFIYISRTNIINRNFLIGILKADDRNPKTVSMNRKVRNRLRLGGDDYGDHLVKWMKQ